MLLIVAFVGSAFALPNISGRPNERWWSDTTYQNPLWNWLQAADTQIESGSGLGAGKAWYVNSNVTTEGNGSDWDNAFDTLQEAFVASLADSGANRGDWVHVSANHAESGVAADLWDVTVAGITVKHHGNGSNMGTYTFADTDTTVAIGAANVTIIGGRLLAGISEVVVGLSVEAAGTNFTAIGMQWPEPLTSTFEFNIGVQLTTASNDATFIGCTAYSADATGADHWINGGAGVVSGLTLVGNKIHGEYAIAPIFSDQIDLETYIRYNDITQLTASQFGIEYTAAATGICADNRVNATVLFEVDPGSMAYWQNMEGDTLPEGVSANGQIGAFTGPAAGTASDDNVKASLDILQAAQEPSASHPNYFTVVADMTSATWNTVAAHEIATVTGSCRVQIIIETTATVITASTNGTMALGFAGNTSAIFSATALDAAITNDVWTAVYGSAATTVVGGADAKSALTSCILDVVVVGGVDIGYTIATNAGTTGDLTFHIYWTPLDATGAVVAGAGGAL